MSVTHGRPGPETSRDGTPDGRAHWTARQAMMEQWYRDLSTDPEATIGCFDWDYLQLRPILEHVTGRILDIGGGLGLPRQFLPHATGYVNVEPSPFWQQHAWPSLDEKFPVLQEPVAVVRAFGEHLPFADGTFDGVLALWSLNHTVNPELVLREAGRVLKPGGHLVVALEDIQPTPGDVAEHPELGAFQSTQVQADHIEIREPDFLRFVSTLDVVDRRWAWKYLTFTLTKRRTEVPTRRPAVDQPQEISASRTTASRGVAPVGVSRSSVSNPSSESRRFPAGDLAWTLARTDFKMRYHGTLGGLVWALLKPAAMFAVLLAVFSFVFPSDPTYKLNLLIGLFIWDFFAESTTGGLVSLHAKGFLLSKARFPSWVIIVTSASNAAVRLAIFTIILLGYLIATGRAPSGAGIALYLSYVLALVLIVFGISLAGSVVFLRYRDLNQLWEVMIQAGFFLAPIIYPLSIIPERFHFYLYLWPPTAVLQFSRAVLIERTTPTLRAHALLALMTFTVLAVGTVVYRRLSTSAAEHV